MCLVAVGSRRRDDAFACGRFADKDQQLRFRQFASLNAKLFVPASCRLTERHSVSQSGDSYIELSARGVGPTFNSERARQFGCGAFTHNFVDRFLSHFLLQCSDLHYIPVQFLRMSISVPRMHGGRIFYVGARWGQSRGLGGQRKIDTVEH